MVADVIAAKRVAAITEAPEAEIPEEIPGDEGTIVIVGSVGVDGSVGVGVVGSVGVGVDGSAGVGVGVGVAGSGAGSGAANVHL